MNDCEHRFVGDGVRYWEPSDRPMPGGGAYLRLFARVYRCERCLAVRAERMPTQSNSYTAVPFQATPATAAEKAAISEAR